MDIDRAAIADAGVVARWNQHVHGLHAEAEPGDFHVTTPEAASRFFGSLGFTHYHVRLRRDVRPAERTDINNP